MLCRVLSSKEPRLDLKLCLPGSGIYFLSIPSWGYESFVICYFQGEAGKIVLHEQYSCLPK